LTSQTVARQSQEEEPHTRGLSSSSSAARPPVIHLGRIGHFNSSILMPGLKYELESYPNHRNILSEKYKVYACLAPKCGSTNWFHYLLRAHLPSEKIDHIFNNSNFRHAKLNYPEYGLRQHRGYHDLLYQSLLDPSVFKFAVVRHPWRRLISAYKDKFLGECEGSRQCFRKTYMPTLSASGPSSVTLSEMLLAMQKAAGPSGEGSVDMHFRQITKRCSPTFPFDFIGDLDNKTHMDYIRSRINPDLSLEEVSHLTKYATNKTAVEVHCNHATVALAQAFYQDDLETFGFSMDEAMDACSTYGLPFKPRSGE
jgi:hypothetical protein